MNKCLNCNSEVINKFCGTSCQNKYRSLAKINAYNLSPKKCIRCDSNIDYTKRRNKYCCRKCYFIGNADTNNRTKSIYAKNTTEDIRYYFDKSNSMLDFFKSIGYCSRPTTNTVNNIRIKLKEIGLDLDIIKKNYNVCIYDLTKSELFTNRKNYQSARSAITKNARKVFGTSNMVKVCKICLYDKHVDIAHIKPVSEFDGDVKISIINDISNLIALCPNHHWEFDNGYLELKIKNKDES